MKHRKWNTSLRLVFTWFDGIKQISAINIAVFERISLLFDFNKFESISYKFSSANDIASRTSVFVDILHKTDNTDRIKLLSVILSDATSRLIPPIRKKKLLEQSMWDKKCETQWHFFCCKWRDSVTYVSIFDLL